MRIRTLKNKLTIFVVGVILFLGMLVSLGVSFFAVQIFSDSNKLLTFSHTGNIYFMLGMTILAACFLTAICVYFFIRRFLRPLNELEKIAKKMSQGDFDFNLEIKSGDEFEDLGSTFNAIGQSMLKSKNEIEKRVQEQTSEILAEQAELENQKKAVLNVLEDMAIEKERAESILRFLKSIGDGVVAVDLKNQIIFFNDAMEKITNMSSQEVIGEKLESVLNIFKEQDVALRMNFLNEILVGNSKIKNSSEHYLLEKKNGEFVSLLITISDILDIKKEKQGKILLFRDVTEERKIEKTKDEFLSIAAHQLRTPLTGIRWSLEMLADGDMGKLTKDAKDLVELLIENNKRLILLVNDLLDVSRINMGNATEKVTKRGVIHTVQKAIQTLAGFASEREVKVSIRKSIKKEVFVNIGHKHFFQALENIISNAIKYTPSGGKVSVAIVNINDEVIISITDNGIGIPEDEQKNIFNKFFRAKNAVKKDTEGSGLGLNVVKSYVEEAGGKVWFESREDKGTSFFISLPIARSEK